MESERTWLDELLCQRAAMAGVQSVTAAVWCPEHATADSVLIVHTNSASSVKLIEHLPPEMLLWMVDRGELLLFQPGHKDLPRPPSSGSGEQIDDVAASDKSSPLSVALPSPVLSSPPVPLVSPAASPAISEFGSTTSSAQGMPVEDPGPGHHERHFDAQALVAHSPGAIMAETPILAPSDSAALLISPALAARGSLPPSLSSSQRMMAIEPADPSEGQAPVPLPVPGSSSSQAAVPMAVTPVSRAAHPRPESDEAAPPPLPALLPAVLLGSPGVSVLPAIPDHTAGAATTSALLQFARLSLSSPGTVPMKDTPEEVLPPAIARPPSPLPLPAVFSLVLATGFRFDAYRVYAHMRRFGYAMQRVARPQRTPSRSVPSGKEPPANGGEDVTREAHPLLWSAELPALDRSSPTQASPAPAQASPTMAPVAETPSPLVSASPPSVTGSPPTPAARPDLPLAQSPSQLPQLPSLPHSSPQAPPHQTPSASVVLSERAVIVALAPAGAGVAPTRGDLDEIRAVLHEALGAEGALPRTLRWAWVAEDTVCFSEHLLGVQ